MKKLVFGTNRQTGQKVILNLAETINSNGIIWGMSGVGKTHMIRAISRFYAEEGGLTSIIFDVHGDIFPNADWVSTVKISETSNVGLQPFEISEDLEFGGVNRAIKRFIHALETSGSKLGARQIPTLTRILEELFWRNGFYVKDPRTWSLHYDPYEKRNKPKAYPTFNDLLRFIKSKRKEIFLGTNIDTVKELEKFLSLSSKATHARVRGEEFTGEFSDEAVSNAKKAALEAYKKFLDKGNDEKILNSLLTYTSYSVLSSIIDRLESLEKTGLFKDEPIRFDPSKKIHRYDISSLSRSDQKIFIQLTLSKIYLDARKGGFGGPTRGLIFVDEAKNYIDESEENMIKILFNEVRKFGLGIWVAGQRSEHFDDDIITNAGTKLILGIDSPYIKKFSTRLQIPIEWIQNIAPHKSMILEIKAKTHNYGFMEVDFE